jgi:hypothetical protein
MEIRKEINGFYELADMVWSGAVDTLEDIQNANKENEFMDFLEMVFCDDVPTDTEVNDFIWFERDYIYEHCGLDENGEEPMDADEIEEMKREQETDLIKAETFDDFCGDRCCELCLFGDCVMKCEDVFAEYKNGDMNIDDILE